MERGLTHVYTGNGKGKTTAALGMAMRAMGWGWNILIIQFLKGGESGEKKFIRELRTNQKLRTENQGLRTKEKNSTIEIESFGTGKFVNPKKLTVEDFEEAGKGLILWKEEMAKGVWDLIILDEIIMAVKFGLAPLPKVLKLILQRPGNLELVLTGRFANQEIIKLADYVTEFKAIRHPYKRGIKARVGIEY